QGNTVLEVKPHPVSQIGLMMTFHSHEMAPWILFQTSWTTPHRVLKSGTRTPVMTFQSASQIGLMMLFQANEMALLMNPHTICTTLHRMLKIGSNTLVMTLQIARSEE